MPQSLTSVERSNPPARRKACLACIKAKRRCNLAQPTCLRCSQRRVQCRYRSEESGRESSIQLSLPTDSDGVLVESVVRAVPLDSFQPVDSLNMSSAGVMLGDMSSSSDNQLSLFNNSSFFDFDQMPPELSLSSPLSTVDPPRDVFSSDNEQPVRIQSPFSLIPSRTKQLESLNAAVKNRLQYSISQLIDSPRRMALENGNPWSHPLLYCYTTPRSIEDVQACCALYLAKNNVNAPLVLSTISSRASELASRPLPKSQRDLLAHTHALLLYSIMRLFDGDIQARKLAEQDMPVLESAALALLPLITFPDPETAPQALSLYPLTTSREFWNDWILQESSRRTFLMVFFYRQIYRLLCGIPPLQCDGKLHLCHCWTMSSHLWGAGDTLEFAEAWGSRKQFLIANANFRAVVDGAMAEDVDDYAKMMLTGLMGIDEFKGWMMSRGGSL